MELELSPTEHNSLATFLNEYANSLSSPIDSFLEDHILNSEFFSIKADGKIVGYFAIFKNNLLTQFFLEKEAWGYSQNAFSSVLDKFEIKSAYVPTSDELFLSLALDVHKKVELQAYFFVDNKNIKLEPPYKGNFAQASIDDAYDIEKISGDFFDFLEKRIKEKQIFTFRDEKELLGAGIVEKSRLLKGYASIGMFTNEKFRMKGIGTSIIIHLKAWCYSHGLIPISGCWYQNTNSKKTLERAGLISKSRLLNIIFK
ncbi:MAG: GNAT family N-acetyltransferase [Thermoplasmata archaeon]